VIWNTTLTIQPVLISCDVKTNIHVHLSRNYHLTTNHLGYGNRCLRLPCTSGAHDYRRFSRHHLCSVVHSCKSDRGLQWSGEGENTYVPIDLRSTSPYYSKSQLYVAAEDGGLTLAPLLTYPYQTKHGIYVRTSSNLLSIAHYTLHK
jgi:hypothetical protein